MAATTSLKLDEQTKKRIERLAESNRRSAHWIMREAIDQYLEREERRVQAWDEAVSRWESMEATGRYVAAEDADAWLAQLEAGNRAPPPKCPS